jgi:hypothetical protein
MKRCPFCAEEVQEAAVVCKHCHRDIPASIAMDRTDAPSADRPTPVATTVVTPPPKAPRLGLAQGNLRNVAIGVLVLGVVLARFQTTMGFGALAMMVATYLLVRGRILVRLVAAVVVPSIIYAGVSPKVTTSSTASSPQAAAAAPPPDTKTLESQMRQAMAAKQWDQAQAFATLIRRANATYPALAEADPLIRSGHVETAITQAADIADDPKQCDTAKMIADTWTKLKQAMPTDTNWSKAQMAARQLERCRKNVEQATSKGLRAIMITQRDAWRDTYETDLLKKGINADVTLSGSGKDQVRIKWALISKAAVYQITDGGKMGDGSFLGSLQKMGFQKVTFTDGFDETWYYTLKPQDEQNGGKITLAGMGLDQPLVLAQ